MPEVISKDQQGDSENHPEVDAVTVRKARMCEMGHGTYLKYPQILGGTAARIVPRSLSRDIGLRRGSR
jgi:hypothetical protein